MLVIDVSVNRETFIDNIQIQRVKSTKSGLNTYKIINPKGFEMKPFKHRYDDGYLPLLKMIIDCLIECGYNPKNMRFDWVDLHKET